jgi:hypothetical protein
MSQLTQRGGGARSNRVGSISHDLGSFPPSLNRMTSGGSSDDGGYVGKLSSSPSAPSSRLSIATHGHGHASSSTRFQDVSAAFSPRAALPSMLAPMSPSLMSPLQPSSMGTNNLLRHHHRQASRTSLLITAAMNNAAAPTPVPAHGSVVNTTASSPTISHANVVSPTTILSPRVNLLQSHE